jgi:N-methylhydantoinase A
MERVAGSLGLGPELTAQGILRVLLAVMEREVRGVFAQLGEDPRNYSLIAFGGAGPLYATSLAREMKIPRVIVPVSPGTFSALGLIVSDIRHDYVRTRLSPLKETDFPAVQSVFDELEDQALNDFSAVDIGTDQVSFSRILDLRYSGQGYELGVPFNPEWKDLDLQAREAFDDLHLNRFGHKAERLGVEIVNYHLVATIATPSFSPRSWNPREKDPRKGERKAFFSGWVDVPVWDRYALPTGFEMQGPAIVEEMDSTTVILDGQKALVDDYGNLRITES